LENKQKKPPRGNVRFSISLSDEQKKAKEQIIEHAYSFVVGKAGSGKTLLAVQIALDMHFKRQYNKIVITRPTVATEDNGFLPGSEKEKMEPWLVPIVSNMKKVYNKEDKIQKMMDMGDIELVSLSHFRGRTFDNSVVIVDEFQNLTKAQLNMCLGRLGKESIMIFCGDYQQIDLRDENYSAINEVAKIKDSEYVFKVVLEDNHRHPAVDDVLRLLTGY
jgi:phosphate starvation-inducible PhoH-like protein